MNTGTKPPCSPQEKGVRGKIAIKLPSSCPAAAIALPLNGTRAYSYTGGTTLHTYALTGTPVAEFSLRSAVRQDYFPHAF